MRRQVSFGTVIVLSGLGIPLLGCILACSGALTMGCSSSDDASGGADSELRGPGSQATDARAPELGNDLNVLRQSKVKMSEALAQSKNVIEAKFELGDDKKLALSLYPLDKGFDVDAEHQTFKELAGDPTVAPFSGKFHTFEDQEHLTRSARDLTLVQLSRISISEAVSRVEHKGFVYWAIPTIRGGRAGYGVYTANGNTPHYEFVDGNGSRESRATDLGKGPGAQATDTRLPKLADLSVLAQSKIKMAEALAASESEHGPAIEAKFEIGDDKKLSLSIYPVEDAKLDAERSVFTEQSGDPTVKPFKSKIDEFKVPDAEHLTRSARDLTLVQTASMTLRQAVAAAEKAVPGGFVYWAIPTIRDTRAGYGIYVYGTKGDVHYLFVS